jgi:hypothetical protein
MDFSLVGMHPETLNDAQGVDFYQIQMVQFRTTASTSVSAVDIESTDYIDMVKSATKRNTAKNVVRNRMANANIRSARTNKISPAIMAKPVSMITTAPVAIGNTVRATKPVTYPTRDGCIAQGRDFCFAPIGTAGITTWCCVGGTPLTPAAFTDSNLRQYMQMYQKFKWLSCTVHYITSSPTNSSGDIVFYYGKNRDSVFLNQTSNQFLPFVMSDPNTVIGPQWTNHSASLEVTSDWKSTDYGMNDDISEYACGEVFLLSKTTTEDAPGYVIFDYSIEFKDRQITPRLLSLPLPRAQYSQFNLGKSATASTKGNIFFGANTGNNLSNTASAEPVGATVMDVYKCIVDVTNSEPASWVNCTVSNLLQINSNSSTDAALTIGDGLTIYAVYQTSGVWVLYPNSTSAYAQINHLEFGVTGTLTWNLQLWVSLVGTINTTNLLPNF